MTEEEARVMRAVELGELLYPTPKASQGEEDEVVAEVEEVSAPYLTPSPQGNEIGGLLRDLADENVSQELQQAIADALERQERRIKDLEFGNDFLRHDRAKMESLYAEEYETIVRVWKALGISSYEQAKGKAIFEIVAELQETLAALRAENERQERRIKDMEFGLDGLPSSSTKAQR